MPYEVESPLAAGLGAATAWYQGQQQGEDRQRKYKAEEDDRALAASTAATNEQYRRDTLKERDAYHDQLGAEKKRNDDLVDVAKADRLKLDKERAKLAKQNALVRHLDVVAEARRKQFNFMYGQTHVGAAAQERINTMVNLAREHIISNQIISSNRLEELLTVANIKAAVSRDNNVRTTDTSRLNNKNTNTTKLEGIDRHEFGLTDRFNVGEKNKGARADQAQSIRAKKAVPSSPVAQAQMHLTPKQQGLLFEVRGALRDGAQLSAIQARMFANARKGMYTMLDAQAALDAVQGKETPSPPPPAAAPGGGPAQQPPFPGVR